MMRRMLGWVTMHRHISEAEQSGQDAEVQDLRSKMQREATKLSLVNKIALRSALLNEMIGVRDQGNDHH